MACAEGPAIHKRRSSIDHPLSMSGPEEVRVIIFGPSQLILTNCLLRRQQFVSDLLESVRSVGETDGKKISVISVPNLCKKEQSWNHFRKEFRKCVCLSSPGPHAVLFALDNENISPADAFLFWSVVKYFGEGILSYTLIFCHEGHVRREHLEEAVVKMTNCSELAEKCHFFSKDWREARTSGQLLEKIEALVTENRGRFFSNKDYKKTECSIQREEIFIRKVREKELARKQEELERRYQGEELNVEKDRFRKRTEEEIREKAQNVVLDRLGNAPRIVDHAVAVGKGMAVGILAGVVLGQEGMIVGGAIGAVVGGVIGGTVRALWRYITWAPISH